MSKAMQMLFEWLSPRPQKQVEPRISQRHNDAELTDRAALILKCAGFEQLAINVRAKWSKRLKTTAGIACFRDRSVTLNPQLQRFGDAEVERTLRHELAHLIAHERAGRRRISAHGPEWREACVLLGIPNENRCHTLPLQGRRRLERKLCYACKACGAKVMRVRPFKQRCACLTCCRKHNKGRYDERFRLVKVAL